MDVWSGCKIEHKIKPECTFQNVGHAEAASRPWSLHACIGLLYCSTSDQGALCFFSRDLNLLFLPASVLDTRFPGGSVHKESTCNAGEPGLIPGSGRSPGEGPGNPLWYSWTAARQAPLPMESQELDMT